MTVSINVKYESKKVCRFLTLETTRESTFTLNNCKSHANVCYGDVHYYNSKQIIIRGLLTIMPIMVIFFVDVLRHDIDILQNH